MIVDFDDDRRSKRLAVGLEPISRGREMPASAASGALAVGEGHVTVAVDGTKGILESESVDGSCANTFDAGRGGTVSDSGPAVGVPGE